MQRFDRFRRCIGVERESLSGDDPRSLGLESSRPRNPLRLALLNKVQLAVKVPAVCRNSLADTDWLPEPPSVSNGNGAYPQSLEALLYISSSLFDVCLAVSGLDLGLRTL